MGAAAEIRGSAAPRIPPRVDETWDAGELACGELVLQLRSRLLALSSGSLVQVIARDPGAPADLPAWCRMTGHALVWHAHPVYLIRRKED